MKNQFAAKSSKILHKLPSIDEILSTEALQDLRTEIGSERLTDLARAAVDAVRSEVKDDVSGQEVSRPSLLAKAILRIENACMIERNSRLRRVINATGVIIHTNLGRAPLSEEAKNALLSAASGYCTLEYNVETGKRGKRGVYVEKLLAEITGAESAVIVNNCAAAAFLILKVFADGGEVIVSRGELVEIGGDFRVPDVLAQSGARLHEVGTTNRTKLTDYENAIADSTSMILKVHPSNYRIIGFTETPGLSDLAALAHRRNILLYEDAGSGAIFDLSKYGLVDEPVISQSIAAGADIVSFSGDKLLGGPQSGLIVGRSELIEQIRKHPLYRALRVDKLTNAALDATLNSYRRDMALDDIPVLRMLSLTSNELEERTNAFAQRLQKSLNSDSNLQVEVISGNSVVGGGAAPMVGRKTKLIALVHKMLSAEQLEERLRSSEPPVITRIQDDKVLIDLRTVFEAEEPELMTILKQAESDVLRSSPENHS